MEPKDTYKKKGKRGILISHVISFVFDDAFVSYKSQNK
jgi:hypothetical protein